MPQEEPSGRDRLIEAARSLFADRGIDAVSLREIARTAEQRNTNAVQYHFGDRDALLVAVLEPFHRLVAARRHALLDELDGAGIASLRSLAGALVRPSAAMLDEAGGRDYLRIMSELIRDPANLRGPGMTTDTGLGRWDRLAKDSMPTETLPLHRRFSAIQLCFNELGRRSSASRRADHRLFVSDLVDLVSGVLGAPVSDETATLLTERPGRERSRLTG